MIIIFQAQEYLPKELSGTKFYDPGKNAREEEIEEVFEKFMEG
jgi:putative ATPase